MCDDVCIAHSHSGPEQGSARGHFVTEPQPAAFLVGHQQRERAITPKCFSVLNVCLSKLGVAKS